MARFPPREGRKKRSRGGPIVLSKLQTGLDQLRGSGSFGNLRHVSVATSPSGSYNTEDIMAYLEKALPSWETGRGWRILLVDAFSAHLDECVARLAWDRGYMVVYIGGGCTGAIQVLDTHLHGRFSALFQEQEMTALLEIMDEDPGGLPVLNRDFLLSTVVSIWQSSQMHVTASKGFRGNMFTLALDGSEDSLGSEECRSYWQELNMSKLRSEALEQVSAAVADGGIPLTYESYRDVLEMFPERGHMDVIVAGQEDEGCTVAEDKALHEAPWDDGEVSPAASDNGDSEAGNDGEEEEEDGPFRDKEVCRQVHLYLDDLNRYDKMMGESIYGKDHAIVQSIKRARRAVVQKMLGKGQEDALIATAMRKIQENEDVERSRKRAACQRKKAAAASLKDSRAAVEAERTRVAELRARVRLQAEALQQERETLDAVRHFDTCDFVSMIGQRTQARRNRWVAMQRVLLLCKALPPASIKSLSRDWSKWDSCNLNSTFLFPTPESYAIKYMTWIQMLLERYTAGKPHDIAKWWLKEVEKKVPEADLVLPPLAPDLLTQASHLVDDGPGQAASSGG